MVRIDNKDALLRPGMNAEVEVHVGRRDDVLAVPNAALRTDRDVGSAAQVLGLSPEAVQKTLAGQRDSGTAGQSDSGTAGRRDTASRASMGAAPAAAGGRRQRPGGRSGARSAQGAGNRYIVFVTRNGKPTPVWIRTGLTDLDYSEVVDGLTLSDSVLVLPSASLVQSQQESRERMNRITGGGGAVPGMQQQSPQPTGGARP
jgi:HlyD family secretion protein